MSPEDREKAIRAANTRHRALVGRPQDGRELTAIATTVDAVLARPVEITDEQREQIVVAIQDHVMPRLARPTSAEAGALREAVNRALSAALSPAEPKPVEEDDELEPVLLCALCRRGAGGWCNTPGCGLWLNRAPDIPVFEPRETPW